MAPPDLEAWNANLVGGDLGGGSNAWHRQLVFRPLFPYFRYRMPVKGLYLCSSYAHPGAGVHGMCGANAALIAARDADRRGVVRVVAELDWRPWICSTGRARRASGARARPTTPRRRWRGPSSASSTRAVTAPSPSRA